MNNIKKGIAFGAISGMTWGLDTVLIGIALTMIPFTNNLAYIAIAPLVAVFIHDGFSAFWTLVYIKNKWGTIKKSLFSKGGLIIIIASLFGGPIGMTGYLLGVKYSGPAYAASFSAIYPAIGALFAYLFLKEKLNIRSWVGILISVIGIVGVGYSPINLTNYPDFYLGMIFSLVCVLGWSLESVIVAYGMKYGKIDPEIAMLIRQLTSFIIYGALIIPFIGGFFLVADLINTKAIVVIAITAIAGTVSYLTWYKSINSIGAARGMTLNITYVVWAILFQKLFLNIELSAGMILWSLAIVLGVSLVAGNPKEMINFQNKVNPQKI